MPGFLLRHEVTVEPYEGDSANGPLYGAPVTVRCFLEEKGRMVRGREGGLVLSAATFYCRLDAIPDAPPESLVTLPDGRQSEVIVRARHDGGGLPTPDHLEVSLV
jgi:hypothetical protein